MPTTPASAATPSSLALDDYLQAQREVISSATDSQFPVVHERFVTGLQAFAAAAIEASVIETHAEFFSGQQRRYLALQERLANIALLETLEETLAVIGDQLKGKFAQDSYQRVRELLVFADLSVCRRLVMVGCGAFPATLLWFSDHFPDVEYIGLDIDAACVTMATRLAEVMGRRNLQFLTIDGGEFDYSGADFVYIANHVVPKRTVLDRLLQSATPNLQVVVREPTAMGELLAASARGELPEGFVISACGEASSAFLSYDLALRWQGGG